MAKKPFHYSRVGSPLDQKLKNLERRAAFWRELRKKHDEKQSMQWHVYDNKYSDAAKQIIGDDD